MSAKIIICYSDAGNGPITAARVIKEASKMLSTDRCDVSIIDVLKQTSKIGSFAVNLYNYLLTKNSIWNTLAIYVFYHSDLIKSGALFAFSLKTLIELLEREHPSVIVFTNPWIIGYVVKAVRKLNFRPRMISLVIDLGEYAPPSWYHSDVDLFIVPTEEAKSELVKYGALDYRIKVLGMPLNYNLLTLSANDERKQTSNYFCKDCTDRVNILIMAGRSGTKNTYPILKYLMESDIPMHISVLCGRNRKLKHKIHNYLYEYRERSKLSARKHCIVLGFESDVFTYMKAADIIITKPGALTISEAIILGIPLILDTYPAIMGQEVGNVRYVEHRQLGLVSRQPKDVPQLVEKLLKDTDLRNNIQSNLNNLKCLYGTIDIIKAINEIIEDHSGSSETCSDHEEKLDYS
jgi:UDP-N-acetylglucosamine:LPS N-acetylglucosamine transferase